MESNHLCKSNQIGRLMINDANIETKEQVIEDQNSVASICHIQDIKVESIDIMEENIEDPLSTANYSVESKWKTALPYEVQYINCANIYVNEGMEESFTKKVPGLKGNQKYASKIQESKNEAKGVKGVYKCEKCPRTYAWRRNLLRHEHIEHDELSFSKFICDFCGYVAKEKSHLLRHISCRHLKIFPGKPEARYECGICGNSYVHKHTLLRHKQYVCNQKPQSSHK